MLQYHTTIFSALVLVLALPKTLFNPGGYRLFVDLGEDLGVAEELVLLLTGLDGRTTKLGDQDAVADSDAHGQALAILVEATGSDGEDLGLVQLLDARLGQEDAAGRLGLGLDTLHENAVQEGGEGADRSDGGGHCDLCGSQRA
jgi:hypothetical protein